MPGNKSILLAAKDENVLVDISIHWRNLMPKRQSSAKNARENRPDFFASEMARQIVFNAASYFLPVGHPDDLFPSVYISRTTVIIAVRDNPMQLRLEN
jgi:hypothetical protein